MQIELNEQEAQVLLNFIDRAVRASGLEAVEGALHFKNKIEAAARADAAPPAPPAPEDDAAPSAE